MAIQRWDPVQDLLALQDRVNRMFDETLSRSPTPGGSRSLSSSTWKPALDLYEESGRYVLRADLPGMTASDVEVRVEEGELILRGERKGERGVSRESFLRVERPQGHFAVKVALPPSVDRQRVEAHHTNGVLEVVLPKKVDEAASRIEISAG